MSRQFTIDSVNRVHCPAVAFNTERLEIGIDAIDHVRTLHDGRNVGSVGMKLTTLQAKAAHFSAPASSMPSVVRWMDTTCFP